MGTASRRNQVQMAFSEGSTQGGSQLSAEEACLIGEAGSQPVHLFSGKCGYLVQEPGSQATGAEAITRGKTILPLTTRKTGEGGGVCRMGLCFPLGQPGQPAPGGPLGVSDPVLLPSHRPPVSQYHQHPDSTPANRELLRVAGEVAAAYPGLSDCSPRDE